MINKKVICITLAAVLCCSTVKPTIAQPVPVLALPLVSNPVGLVFVSTVVVGTVIWYIYKDRQHHKFRSRIAPSGNLHKIEPGRHNVGDIVYPGDIVNSREECQRVAREYGERTDGGEWEVIDYIRLGQVHDGVSDPRRKFFKTCSIQMCIEEKEMTQDVYEFSNDGRWGIACKFYKDGEEHVTVMDFISPISLEGTLEDVEKHINVIFQCQINQPYQDHLLYSPYPKERVEGFVYDGFRVKRSHKLEQEFVEIEKNLHSYPDNIGYIREIHKYYYYETWRGIKTYREVIESKAIEDQKIRVQEYSNGEKVHWLDLRRIEVEKLSNSSNSFYLPGFFDEKQKQDKINELERAGSDWIPEFELLSKSQLSPRYLCKLVRAVKNTSQNYIHQASA